MFSDKNPPSYLYFVFDTLRLAPRRAFPFLPSRSVRSSYYIFNQAFLNFPRFNPEIQMTLSTGVAILKKRGLAGRLVALAVL